MQKQFLKISCICYFIILSISNAEAQIKNNISFSTYYGSYFGQLIDSTPNLFAPNCISTPLNEINAAFSPDGNEIYFSIGDPLYSYYAIHVCKKINNRWTMPEIASFSGCYSDADPCFSPDGKRLYFISKRPIQKGDTIAKIDFDIWYVERLKDTWGEPVHLDSSINTKDNQFYVSVTNNGNIYYATQNRIHKATLKGNTYQVSTLNIGDSAYKTTKIREGDVCVDPNEHFLIVSITGAKDGLGYGDLYISFNKNGTWTIPENLGPIINSSDHDFCPMLSPDGKYLFFTSDRAAPLSTTTPKNHKSFIERLNRIENGASNIYCISFDYIKRKFGIK